MNTIKYSSKTKGYSTHLDPEVLLLQPKVCGDATLILSPAIDEPRLLASKSQGLRELVLGPNQNLDQGY
jgi:hypothetical protein